MALVEIDMVYDAMAAEIARGRLASAGFGVVLFDAGIVSLIGGGLGGVRIMVEADDAEAARALLADLERDSRCE